MITIVLAFSLLDSGVHLSMLCAAIGLAFAFFLITAVIRKSAGNERMQQISAAVQEGAKAYLNRQVVTISAIAVVIFILLFIFKDHPTAIGFVIGAFCSLSAGFIGMRIAVIANVRTTQAASQSRTAALRIAFNGGAVTGLLVVGLALLAVSIFYTIAGKLVGHDMAVRSLVGLALGASLISVFARLGGGIYTKAADVGADLVGKIEKGLEEDDPRNPATIADNVGDNVGDCAGMAADVFETYAVSLIGAILVGALTLAAEPAAIIYPFVLGGISVLGAILGVLFVNVANGKPASMLMGAVGASALVSAILFWPATHRLFPNGITVGGLLRTPTQLYFASVIGLVMTAVVVVITNYYTSMRYRPVQKIARASETGHATNIIAGLAVGQHATALPVGFIGIAILLSFHFAGLYGIAIAVMSMLSMAGIIISLDSFGPITDNAGGIAVMSNLPKEIRAVTDELDAVGNTMKAVTKGYAIASAGLAALVLFGSYVEELRDHVTARGDVFTFQFSLTEPKVIIGLFIGGLLPFIFTAFSMDAVGKAAGAVVLEVRRQLQAKPGILTGQDTPEYGTCVDIVTKAALREMIIPALLPLVFVVAVAIIPQLGPVVLGGLLVGTIVTGLFVAIAMTSGGGAWDNAKKFIEEGNLGGKGSFAHAAAVTGDTVGDPYKDTAGPAINPMIKVANIVAILIIPIFF
ncbi:MAG: sodium-translocating pyrophosphatase [Verrucomicrobia bacterium]|nr:MAG: sodium-translocating pyrophosphatase [Verrucomicrobiota bacterium]PYL37313.1 MAG: sodium-translocating pyrophosphatase [Verrucomicrobiota bacterium]